MAENEIRNEIRNGTAENAADPVEDAEGMENGGDGAADSAESREDGAVRSGEGPILPDGWKEGDSLFPQTKRASETANPSPAPPALTAELEALRRLYPEAADQTLPAEVLQTYRDGGSLVNAYAAFRARSDAETIAALRAENEALKRASETASRAPVRGVTGGAAPDSQPADPFLQGLESEW